MDGIEQRIGLSTTRSAARRRIGASRASSVAFVLVMAEVGMGRAMLIPEGTDRVQPVVEVERAFCADAASRGVRAAFLTYMAEDGVIFQPTPTNARASWEKREDLDGSLRWWPEIADIARSGELGYTLGPWHYRTEATGDSVVASGVYLTVWKRQADGSWQAAADGGITTPSALPVPVTVNAPAASTRTFASDPEALSAFDASSDRAPRAAWTAADCQLLRTGHAPFVGLDTCERELGEQASTTTHPERALVATSGELGATWGTYASGAETGGYLRVWRRTDSGDWTLIAESLRPAE